MKYPNGKSFVPVSLKTNKPIEYASRGMELEEEINLSNQCYLEIGKAVIYKKPTPIKVVDVDYKNGKVIKKAFFENPSTTDYNGIYKGRYIDFEAKETILKTSFPLKNIHTHQIEHMMKIIEHGGICFLIVRFQKLQKTYLLLANDLKQFLKNESRSSIPLSFFEKFGYLIEEKYQPRLDYLSIVDKIIGGGLNG